VTQFVFDLDGTLLRGELLPAIAAAAGLNGAAMEAQTMQAVLGGRDFSESFPERVAALRSVPVELAAQAACAMPRYEQLCAFLRAHRDRCWIATGNLDVWIGPLLRELDMAGHCFCAKAQVENGFVTGILSLADKAAAVRRLPRPVVAVGDGANDCAMLAAADVGIAFGGLHPVPEALLRSADQAVEEETALLSLLQDFL